MKFLFLSLALLVPVPAAAQTPILLLPTSTLRAAPNTDYNALDLAGNPITTGVKVKYCLTAAPTNCLPTITVSPKPALVGGEIVIADVISSIQPNTSYTAQLIAFGQGGDSAASNLTLPFGNAVLAAPQALTNVRIVR